MKRLFQNGQRLETWSDKNGSCARKFSIIASIFKSRNASKSYRGSTGKNKLKLTEVVDLKLYEKLFLYYKIFFPLGRKRFFRGLIAKVSNIH